MNYEKQEQDKLNKKKFLLTKVKKFLTRNGFDIDDFKFRFNYWRNEISVFQKVKKDNMEKNLGVYFCGNDDIDEWNFTLKSINYFKKSEVRNEKYFSRKNRLFGN